MKATLSRKNVICFTLVAILCVLHYTSALATLIDFAGHNALIKSAQATLGEDLSQNLATLGVLELAKDVFGMAESSVGGVSLGLEFEVQVGRVISTMVDAIDEAISGLSLFIKVLVVLDLILDVAPHAAWLIFDAFFFLLFIYASLCMLVSNARWLYTFLRKSMELLLVVGLLLYCVIPLSLWTAGKLSAEVAALDTNHHHKAIHGALSIASLDAAHDNKGRIKWVKEKLHHYEEQRSEWTALRSEMLHLIAILFVKGLVLPLSFVLLGHCLVARTVYSGRIR